MEQIVFAGLSGHAWIAVLTMLAVFAILICTKLPADFVFLGALAVLLLTGTLNVEEALSGFSDSSVVTVGLMFVLVAGLSATGALHWVTRKCLGTPKTYSGALLRLMSPVAAVSAFLSNTTVVSMFLQIVMIWSKKLAIKPSKLLIPLSYASVFGGLCTMIGTPPNLVISSLFAKETGFEFGFFDVGKVGIICLAIGFVIMIVFRRLLPERNESSEQFSQSKEFTTELLVPSDCPFIGKTVKEAGLAQVDGGHIIEIMRFDREIISPVPDDEFIMGGDRLIFTGVPEKLLKLKASHGLVTASEHVYSVSEVSKDRTLIEAVIPEYSSLVGRTFMGRNFERLYNIVLVAVSREGKRIEGSPRETVIMPGDSLLIECNPDFVKQSGTLEKDLVLLNREEQEIPVSYKTVIAAVVMVAVVLLATFKVMSLVTASLIGIVVILAARCCTPAQARGSISGSTLLVFASSLGVASAVESSGLAEAIAANIQGFCGTNPYIAIITICSITCLLGEFISNTAAAAIFFPIAMQTATALGVNPAPFMISLMISTSSFATPIGSPTHLLIYGPGGYKFTDFMVLGIALDIMVVVVSAFVAPIFWPF